MSAVKPPLATGIASNHPSEIDLVAFAQGKLAEQHMSALVEHLDACPACSYKAEHAAGDSLMERLQGDRMTAETPVGRTVDTLTHTPVRPVADDDLPAELRDHPRYRIIRLLGQGGMGVVYLAEHKLMPRSVVIKVINQNMLQNAEVVDRFRREIQAVGALEHPNIVKAYDAEQAGNLLLLAMEYVDGKNLAEVLDKKGPLPIRNACHYIRQACLGLQHAHEKGMVHRDLKPHNLMLTRDGRVKILDFGLSKLAQEAKRKTTAGLTLEGACLGTPEYLAPEQARDTRKADIRSDIYSLGCTLFCLLTGRPPFKAEDPSQLLNVVMAHVNDPPPALEEMCPNAPPELCALVAQLLAKEPAERLATPKDVADALLPFTKNPAPVAASLFELNNAIKAFEGAIPCAADKPTVESKRIRPGRWRNWVASGIALVALGVVALTLILVKMPDGYVELDVPDGYEVRVDGKMLTVKHPNSEPIRVTVNKEKKTITVVKDGVEIESRELTINDKGKTVRFVRWDDADDVVSKMPNKESPADSAWTSLIARNNWRDIQQKGLTYTRWEPSDGELVGTNSAVRVANGNGLLITRRADFRNYRIRATYMPIRGESHIGLRVRDLDGNGLKGYSVSLGWTDGADSGTSPPGTIGIGDSRRLPKVVSKATYVAGQKKGEWFSLELVMCGHTIQSFVNGILAAEYTDDAKEFEVGRIQLNCRPGSTVRLRTFDVQELPP